MTKTAKLMPEQEDASAIAKLFKSQEELMDSSLLEAELFEGAPEDESPTAALALSPKTARKMIQLRPIESESIRELYQQYRERDLDVQPKFQRRPVWDDKRKSKLIESILLGFPIPLIFLAEDNDNSSKRFVVDGQQRLRALFEFIEEKYALLGLGVDSPYEGMHFKDLAGDGKQFAAQHMKTVTITAESEQDVAFELFLRLNRGATLLNEQELRNAKYRNSPYNEFLIKAGTRERKFRELMRFTANSTAWKRMLDVEAVLRFMAFYDQGYRNHPNKRTTKFLNDQMEKSKDMIASERLKRQKALREATQLCADAFGERAFRRFHLGNRDVPNGSWETRINKSLADVQLYWFTQFPRAAIMRNLNLIREKALDLMSDPTFTDLITHSASDKDRVCKRFEMWQAMLTDVLDQTKREPRSFGFKKREELFAKDPTCRECGQKILLIEDAEVDHIIASGRGGRTVQANAGLTHRFCNRSKATKESRSPLRKVGDKAPESKITTAPRAIRTRIK